MKYKGVSLNYANVGVDMKIDMGLEVFVSRLACTFCSLRWTARAVFQPCTARRTLRTHRGW